MLMGAHAHKLVRTPSSQTLALTLALLLSFMVMSYGDPDSDALLQFKDSLANSSVLGSWDPAKRPCMGDIANWLGVLCYGGNIWGIRLEGMALSGSLRLDSLAPVRFLHTLSLMNNHFQGQFPDVKKLSGLRSLFLSNNRFSGEIRDDAFLGMMALKKVFLANNGFTGKIPSSLATLPRLLELRLNGNQFRGRIPDFQQNDLKLVSFANNDLEGPIPQSLSLMDPSSFAGNGNLCGPPLDPCVPESNANASLAPTETSVSLLRIVIVAIAVGLIFALIFLAYFIFQWRKQKSLLAQPSLVASSRKLPAAGAQAEARKVPEVAGHTKKTDHSKLSFVRDDIPRFDLQDMLRASAEVLGSGTFGASYKAVIMSGQTLVVKRYKQMNNVGREDFHEHMRRLGRLKHANVLPLVAYYYRKEEKLLVTEFVHNNSLANHLHANHTLDQPGLDWITRLKIIKGVARGLAYLYNELPTLNVPHGHLKSSNVLLDESFEALLTDYALRPLMNSEHAHRLMTAYKSPEYKQTGSISRKTDVWCLGILILELLTGRFPENYLTQGYDSNASLATWVSTMVKNKQTSDVFDKEMTGTSKGQMISLLKIGLSCCEEDTERRMDLKEAVDKIGELKEGDIDEDNSLNTNEGNSHISRVTDSDFNFMNR